MATENANGHSSQLDELVRKNVEAISRIEQASLDRRTGAHVVADAIARFCGSVSFLVVHGIFFAVWIAWNIAVEKKMRFDPPPFTLLTLVVSLEAIFLSTFILISQNRQQASADERNHLDLQINMLAEQENSQMLSMLRQIMTKLNIEPLDGNENALEGTTDLERVAEQIQESLGETTPT
jgi:uncharacterized membrane protein